jgi:hypothetical protein
MHNEDALIETLRHARRDERLWHPPLGRMELRDVERRLGFLLPPLLGRLYTEVANGGFAPGVFPLKLPNEMIGSFELETVVAWYRTLRDYAPTEDDFGPDDFLPLLEWPEGLVMICDWGCNIYSCVSCLQPGLPVLRNDNSVSWSVFAIEDLSLHTWLDRALDGENLFRLEWKGASKVRFPTFPRPQR